MTVRGDVNLSGVSRKRRPRLRRSEAPRRTVQPIAEAHLSWASRIPLFPLSLPYSLSEYHAVAKA
jgi:hypothetical protein